MRDLWIGLEAGGLHIIFKIPLVLFLLRSLGLSRGISRLGTDPFFGNVGMLIKERVDELKALELVAEGGGLNEEERERKSLLCRDIERALLQEEISWKQKSRVKWLMEEDKCTKFFHLMANSNKRFNTIDSLLINGSLSSNPDAIREHTTNFYKSMFAESMSWRPSVVQI
jgi:hypothetical protein